MTSQRESDRLVRLGDVALQLTGAESVCAVMPLRVDDRLLGVLIPTSRAWSGSASPRPRRASSE